MGNTDLFLSRWLKLMDAQSPEKASKIAVPKRPEMSEENILTFVKKFYDNAYLARKPLEEVWDRSWDLYNNKYDFSDKQDWQSQRNLSRVFMIVTRAAAILKKALLTPSDFFRPESMHPAWQQKINIVTRSLKYHLMHKKVGFPYVFENMLKSGILSNLPIAKIGWQSIDETMFDFGGKRVIGSRGLLNIEGVSAYNIYLDPTGNNNGILEEARMPLNQFIIWCESVGYDWKKVVDSEGKSVLKTSADTKKYKESDRRRQGQVSENPQEARVWSYWGNVWDKDGFPVWKNVELLVVNTDTLLKKPTPNPFWHGRSPYVVGKLIRDPFGVYHNSIVGANLDMFEAMVELVNLMIDAFSLSSLHQYEIDVDMMEDPGQLYSGVYPGKLWQKSAHADKNAQMLKAVSGGNFDPILFNLFQTLDKEGQIGSGMTDSLTGMPRSKGRTSAMEIAQTAQSSDLMFDAIVQNLEGEFLADILERSYLTILQFQSDYGDAEFARAVFDNDQHVREFLSMSPEERFDVLAGDFKFKVTGLSTMLARREELEKVGYFMRMVGKIEPAVRAIKWDNMMKKVFDALNWETEEIVDPEEFKKYVQEQRVMMEQQVQMRNQQMMMQQQQMMMQAQQPPPGSLQAMGQQPPPQMRQQAPLQQMQQQPQEQQMQGGF